MDAHVEYDFFLLSNLNSTCSTIIFEQGAFLTNQIPEFEGRYKIKPEQPIKSLCVLDFTQKFKI